MICNAVLTPIIIIFRAIIEIIRHVVRTICGWVSSIVKTVKEIFERVCRWLPWPLDKLCDLVKKVVEIVETAWNWVCKNILETIVDAIEFYVELAFYLLKWVCWVVDWIVRFPDLILCWLGLHPRRFITICVKVLADDAGAPAVGLTTVDRWLREASALLDRCDITLVTCSVQIVRKPEFLDGIACGFGGLFKPFFTWFSHNSCGCCSSLTVFVVRDIVDARGCSYPGADWLLIDAEGIGNTIVHEIGHLADMWGHNNDPNNVMHAPSGGQITSRQCCMIRTARFTLGYALCSGRNMPGAIAHAAVGQDDGDRSH